MGTTICGRCKAWINDREWRCRNCGRLLPGLFGQRRWLDTVFARDRSQTRVLIYVLVACYLVELLVSQFTPMRGERPRFSLDPSSLGMLRSGMLTPWIDDPLSTREQPWRLLTAMLLHGGMFHILMNGLSLLSLGGLIEALFGPATMWVLFTLTGIAGNVAVLLFSEHPALGASGGLFGLFGAILGWTVRRGGTVGIEMRRQLMRTLIINIGISCLPGISFAAHAGGFAAGFLATWLFRIAHERSGRESDGVRIAALACIGLLAAGAICAAVAALRWPVA
jgi:membrane associated rhomboid family serine protease